MYYNLCRRRVYNSLKRIFSRRDKTRPKRRDHYLCICMRLIIIQLLPPILSLSLSLSPYHSVSSFDFHFCVFNQSFFFLKLIIYAWSSMKRIFVAFLLLLKFNLYFISVSWAARTQRLISNEFINLHASINRDENQMRISACALRAHTKSTYHEQ